MDLSGHEAMHAVADDSRHPAASIRSALFGGLIATLLVLTAPADLVALIVASAGLGEAVPVLAPPMGWQGQAVLAMAMGLLVSAALLAFRQRAGQPFDRKEGRMGFASNFGWQQLIRIARGEDGPVGPVMSAGPGISFPMPRDPAPRRRVDQHPDAPPRQPLLASRDLPDPAWTADAPATAGDEPAHALSTPSLPPIPPLQLVASNVHPDPDAALAAQPGFRGGGIFDPARPPIRDLSRTKRPRPLPRSPEPLNAGELAELCAMLNARSPRRTSPVAPVMDAPVARDDVAAASRIAVNQPHPQPRAQPEHQPETLPPLDTLLHEFERRIEHRLASDAGDAPEMVTMPAAADPVQTAHTDAAPPSLDDALETLRRLSAGVRRR